MKYVHLSTLALCCLIINGCATSQAIATAESTAELKLLESVCSLTCDKAPALSPMELNTDIKTTLISYDNKEWIGLTPEGWSNLGDNLYDTLSYIEQQKVIINYYEKCISTSKENIDELINAKTLKSGGTK